MPFMVRCSHCQKFMLIEDDLRGQTGPCLVCKQKIVLQSSPTDRFAPRARASSKTRATSPPAATPESAAAVTTPASTLDAMLPLGVSPEPEKVIRECPNCRAKLRLPANIKGRKILCPRCQTEFT